MCRVVYSGQSFDILNGDYTNGTSFVNMFANRKYEKDYCVLYYCY